MTRKETARGTLYGVVAALMIVVAAVAAALVLPVPFAGPDPAGAHGHPYTLHAAARADSDGYVVERYVCKLPAGTVGRYLYRENPDGTVEGKILYDTCNMRAAGAGPTDWRRLKAHERAHARGLDHGEGTPTTNPGYHARFAICRC